MCLPCFKKNRLPGFPSLNSSAKVYVFRPQRRYAVHLRRCIRSVSTTSNVLIFVFYRRIGGDEDRWTFIEILIYRQLSRFVD
jgi:hypothetical protein